MVWEMSFSRSETCSRFCRLEGRRGGGEGRDDNLVRDLERKGERKEGTCFLFFL